MQENFYNIASSKGKFSSELLRDALLPELFGKANNILYWSGKRLARIFPLAKDEDLPIFFEQAEWGTLKRTKAKHDNQYFELSGEPVALRMQLNPKADFLLEAGFLAETIQLQLGFVTEAIIEKQTSNTVTFLIQVDSKDPIDFADYEQEAASPLHLNED